MRWIFLATVILCAGCSGMDTREAGLGYKSSGDEDAISVHYGEYQTGGIGWFAGLAGGGSSPHGDDYDDENPVTTPSPESSLSRKTGSSYTAGNIFGGITYQPTETIAFFAGPSVWVGEGHDEYEWNQPLFGASGRYHVDGDTETIFGALLGIKFMSKDEGGSLGITYDTGTEMIGIEIGISF